MHHRGEPKGAGALLALAFCLAGCVTGDPIAVIEDRREPGSKALVDRLHRGRTAERARAALAMGRIQDASYAADLAAAAGAPAPELRKTALFALGQLGLVPGEPVPEVALRAVDTALDDPAAEIVAAAVEALGKLAGPRVAERIVPLADHPSALVRAEAALALFRLQFVPVWRGESDEPYRLPAPAVEALVRLFDDEEAAVRTAAVYAFSRYGRAEAAPRIAIRLTDDADEWVRLFAARALGPSGDVAQAEALATALDDASFRVRTEAVLALAALGEAHRVHEGLGEDPSFHVRAAAARAWGTVDSAALAASLERLTADPSVTVRAAAVEALAARRGAAWAGRLESWLSDEAWPVRRAAVAAAPAVGPARDGIVALGWADADVRVRTAAVEAADAAGAGGAIVLAALESGDVALRGTAVTRLEPGRRAGDRERAVAAWERSGGADWIEVRETVVAALADDPGADDALRRIAQSDPVASVRRAATTALARRGVVADADQAPAPPRSPYLGRPLAADPIVTLETSRGTLRLRCHAAAAPVHVAHFVRLVRAGFYDGLVWHRVVSNFVVQGGDPRGDGWGQGDVVLRDEINRHRFVRGAVGMPKAGKDTGGCQLFVTPVPAPHLDGNYTVFAQVEQGLDVLDLLEAGDAIVRARIVE